MKKIFLLTVLVFALCLGAYARKLVSEGATHSPLGNYKIELDDNYVKINGFQHRPYVISYENTGMEVRVAVTMERGCRKYYVLSDNLSVQYVSNRHYFGVERLDRELAAEGHMTSDMNLNRDEYFHQKAITSGEKWRADKTALIAAFYPRLLKNTEEVLAVK